MAIQPLSIDANTRQGITPPITEKQIQFFLRIIIHSAQLSILETMHTVDEMWKKCIYVFFGIVEATNKRMIYHTSGLV
jgi:hypothetical protein